MSHKTYCLPHLPFSTHVDFILKVRNSPHFVALSDTITVTALEKPFSVTLLSSTTHNKRSVSAPSILIFVIASGPS